MPPYGPIIMLCLPVDTSTASIRPRTASSRCFNCRLGRGWLRGALLPSATWMKHDTKNPKHLTKHGRIKMRDVMFFWTKRTFFIHAWHPKPPFGNDEEPPFTISDESLKNILQWFQSRWHRPGGPYKPRLGVCTIYSHCTKTTEDFICHRESHAEGSVGTCVSIAMLLPKIRAYSYRDLKKQPRLDPARVSPLHEVHGKRCHKLLPDGVACTLQGPRRTAVPGTAGSNGWRPLGSTAGLGRAFKQRLEIGFARSLGVRLLDLLDLKWVCILNRRHPTTNEPMGFGLSSSFFQGVFGSKAQQLELLQQLSYKRSMRA